MKWNLGERAEHDSRRSMPSTHPVAGLLGKLSGCPFPLEPDSPSPTQQEETFMAAATRRPGSAGDRRASGRRWSPASGCSDSQRRRSRCHERLARASRRRRSSAGSWTCRHHPADRAGSEAAAFGLAPPRGAVAPCGFAATPHFFRALTPVIRLQSVVVGEYHFSIGAGCFFIVKLLSPEVARGGYYEYFDISPSRSKASLGRIADGASFGGRCSRSGRRGGLYFSGPTTLILK